MANVVKLFEQTAIEASSDGVGSGEARVERMDSLKQLREVTKSHVRHVSAKLDKGASAQ
jgi:hypothetical protein